MKEEDEEHSEPNACCPFGRRRKEKKGKGCLLCVNCDREDVVDVADESQARMTATTGERLFVCSQRSSSNKERSIVVHRQSVIYAKRSHI